MNGKDMAKKTGSKKNKLKHVSMPISSGIESAKDITNPNSLSVAVPQSLVLHPISPASRNLLNSASILLAIATGIAFLFVVVMLTLPGGKDAVPAMGGVLQATAPMQTAQIVFFLDILFPITFGAGFTLLATAFQSGGNRPLVRVILAVLLFVVLADFSENALVFKVLTGGETYAVQWVLTVIKYAMLGLSAVLLSTIMILRGRLGDICLIFLRFIFPLSIAALVAGIGGRIGSDVIGATFPLGLLLLAVYAKTLSQEG